MLAVVAEQTDAELARELAASYRKKWGKVKLDVGCGPYPRGEDFITLDKHVGEMMDGKEIKADFEADMWELPFEDGQVDEIWCSHALEHVPPLKVIETLKEFNRVLRAGGRCIVTVPNFDYVAKYWLLGQNRQWAEQMVFGQQQTDGDIHRSCFNSETLKGDLEGCGFDLKVLKIVWTHSQESLQAVAVKK